MEIKYEVTTQYVMLIALALFVAARMVAFYLQHVDWFARAMGG